jgi:hypothetical protein|tara:strand:- start:369 stop:1787 length:1419 start_codon:yes stop_codon:yes gene_type:complete
VDYSRDAADNSIVSRHESQSGDTIEFRAIDLQPNANGKTTVRVFHTPPNEERYNLGSHRYNIEDMTMRTRLGNGAYKAITNGFKNNFKQEDMVRWLYDFTAGLQGFDVNDITAHMVKGNPDWEPEFLAWPHVLRHGLTLLPGQPGATKSTVGLALAISIDAGVDTIWPIQESGPVVIINMERSPQSIAGRIGHINRALGLDGDREILVFNTKGKKLIEIERTLRVIVADKGVYCGVLDSLSRTGLGNLNENQDANSVMDILGEVLPASVVIAHSPKGEEGKPGKGTFGSNMFLAAADLEVNVATHRIGEENTSWTELQISKGNDVGDRKKRWLRIDYGEKRNDWDNRIVSHYIQGIRTASDLEVPDFENEKHITSTESIIRHLNDYGARTASDIARGTGLNLRAISGELNAKKGTLFRDLGNDTWQLLDEAGNPREFSGEELANQGTGILSRIPRLDETLKEYQQRTGKPFL